MTAISKFYRAFEDRHRGSRELIASRLAVYLPFVRAAAQMHPDAKVVDLGCGRGEWLELLRHNGIPAQGIDLDEGMLAACRERNLDVRHGDAIAFLQGLPDNSQAVISGLHIAEHLPFDTLVTLVADSLRVLRPGGLLILETPNPDNLAVGTAGFYTDPTHERPLPAPLLAFLPEYYGFQRVKTMGLQEGPGLRGQTPVTLVDVLAGVSPDYAVVAQKAAGEGASSTAMALLEDAFAQEHGVTLNALAERHERQWASRVHLAQTVAEASRSAALVAQTGTTRALERLSALEQKVPGDVAALQSNVAALNGGVASLLGGVATLHGELVALRGEMATLHRELHNIRQSTSWRVTQPLRWLGKQLALLREHGLRGRLRHLARRVVAMGVQAGMYILDRSPRARRLILHAFHWMGLDHVLARLRTRWRPTTAAPPMPAPAPEPEPTSTSKLAPMPALAPAAQRVHQALKRALSEGAPALASEQPDRKQ